MWQLVLPHCREEAEKESLPSEPVLNAGLYYRMISKFILPVHDRCQFIDFSHNYKHNIKFLHIGSIAVPGCVLCFRQSKVKVLSLSLNGRDLNYLTPAVG